MKVKDQIIKMSLRNPKEEICGFVVFKDNEEKVIQCKNKAPEKDKLFLIGAKDFLNIKRKNEILAVFHSHIIGTAEPSEFDLKMSEALCYPFIIYSIQQNEFNSHVPQFSETTKEKIEKILK